MESSTYSAQQSPGHPDGRRDGLAELAAAVDELVAQDLDGLPDAVSAERVLALRRLIDRLNGLWLKGLAAMDTRTRWSSRSGTLINDNQASRPAELVGELLATNGERLLRNG